MSSRLGAAARARGRESPGADLPAPPAPVPHAAPGPAAAAGPSIAPRTSAFAVPAWTVLAGILALSAVLRFALLTRHSVWLDEAFVVWVARHPWREVLALLRTADMHPPLYYLIMHAWIQIAGTGEAAIRLPSACCGVGAVGLTYVLVRRISTESVGLWSAFLVALSPFQVMAGQEARMYPLAAVLGLASTIALLEGVERGGVMRWGAYVAAATLLAYTHYLGWLVLLAHGVWVAAWERRRLARWAASIAAVAALSAPWIPALLYQIRHVHSYAWYYNPLPSMYVTDLLGLMAFGGSLLGMAGYFFSSTVGPAEHLIVLLPFLVLLWRGTIALARDPRALALVALPPVVTVGVMLLVTLARPMFVPRWFSFLLPFLALVFALGIDDVAEHVRFPRARVVAALVAVLLLYQLTVLSRYYFTPGFRPFHWRAAAGLVQGSARPGDAVVTVWPAGLPFRYYFHDSYPSIDLPSTDPFPLAPDDVRRLAAQHPRLWLIATIPFTGEIRDRVLGGFGQTYEVAGLRNFSGAIVYLLRVRPDGR